MSWSDWFLQLLLTLVGTAVGFRLAMWWDRKKERVREGTDRLNTLKSLHLELTGISGQLATSAYEATDVESRPGAVDVEMSLPFLAKSAFEAAVHSGKLTLLRPDLQEELSTIYEQVRLMRIHVDIAAASYAHGDTVAEHTAAMSNAVNYIQSYGEMLDDQLRVACARLEQAMSESSAP